MLVASKVVNQVMSSVAEGDAVLLEKSLGVLKRNARYGLEELTNRVKPRRSYRRRGGTDSY